MKRYIIIGPARSGTTVTHLILKGHPQVAALSDEVKTIPLFRDGISTFTFGNEAEEEKSLGFKRAFDMLALLNATHKTRAAGIKCAVSSVDQVNIFVDRVKQTFPEILVILTIREDLLAQFGSLKRAHLSGKWHSWVETEQEAPSELRASKMAYTSYFLANIEIIGELRALKETHSCLEISYEKDILSGLGYARKLYEFLELDDVEPTWVKSKKVAPLPQEFIANYEQMKGFEKQLLEGKRPLGYGVARMVLRRISSRTGRRT